MKNQNNTQIAISFILLLVIVVGVFYLLRVLWISFTSIDTSLAAVLITAATTVIVSVISVLISKHVEQKITIKNEHREKKILIYENLIEFLFKKILINAR